jgi:hypothetical protein
MAQLLVQSNNDCCGGRGRRKAADRLLWGAVCQYCSLTVRLVLERSSGGGFVSGGTAELPFLTMRMLLSHTQNSHVLHFAVQLKMLGESRKGRHMNGILLYRVLFLSYLNDQSRSIALVKFLLDFLKVITTAIVCLAAAIDS